MEKCIFCIHECKEMILHKLCFQPFVETSLCLFGLIHLSVHWIQRQLLHSTIQGHLTTKLAEPCQWFYKFKIIEKVYKLCVIARFSPHTQAMYDFSSHQTPYFALYQLLGAGVFEAKVEHNSMSAQVLGDFGVLWGANAMKEENFCSIFFIYKNIGFGCMTLWFTQPSFGPFQNMCETFEDNILFWSAKLGVYPVCQVNSSFIVLPHPSNPMVGKPKKS